MTSEAVRAIVVQPLFKKERPSRDINDVLEEMIGLARSANLEVVDWRIVRLIKPSSATFFTVTAVEDLRVRCSEGMAEIVVVNGSLSPIQQRNLERDLKVRVIDRAWVILEIFRLRACTREGWLQVELARLTYQRSRLVRSWTHLERQRGGFGFLGGPGESQLEIDRRLITRKIVKIQEQLEAIKRMRALQRKPRQEYPVAVLVGYTNAGKSTLFNRLVQASVFAGDHLFATLDPTMRRLEFPSGRSLILVDTVGFIADLPTHLIAAFRATLEDVERADLILHVRDISHHETSSQQADVYQVLSHLGIERPDCRLIEVCNKIDRLEDGERRRLELSARRSGDRMVPVSAIDGQGLDALVALLDRKVNTRRSLLELRVPCQDGEALAWLYRHGQICSREDDDSQIRLRVRLDPIAQRRFEATYRYLFETVDYAVDYR